MNAQVPVKIKSQRSEPQNCPSEIRVAYPYFHEKRTKNAAGVLFVKKDGTPNPRFSGVFMFPKLSAEAGKCANYMFLWNLAIEAARKMWPTNLDASGQWVWPVGAQYSVRDGDVPFTSKPKPGVIPPTAEELAQKNAWRKGYWIVEAENFLDPGPKIAKVIGGTEQELPAKVVNGVAQYKGGDFAIVNFHAYAYQNETFGVNFGFDGACFTREGDAIGGGSAPRSVSQMFGGVAGTVAPQPGPAPQSPVAAAPSLAPALPSAPPGPPMPPGAMAPAAPPLPAFPR